MTDPELQTPERPPAQAQGRRTPLWVKLLLGVSLALNLVIAGMIAGVALRGGPDRADAGGPRGAMVLVTTLDKDDRRAILRGARDGFRDSRTQGRAEMQQILNVLSADTLDVDALRAILTAQQQRGDQMRGAMQDRYLETVSGLSDQDRAAYVARLRDRLEKRRKPGKK